ncbi:hypothetical protein, partial [Bacillus sp. V3B]|uniref:hypothetical protein n=1 Tax=Bacillus sp. V3B TaxID=2804915 RepID=UPI0021089250
FKPRLNEVKPPADASDFLKVIDRASSIKIRAQIRRGEFDHCRENGYKEPFNTYTKESKRH